MSQIFISYSSKDRQFTLKLADNLEKFFKVWIDREGLEGGLEWERAIEEALKTCSIFLVVVSPNSNESDWVARETILAEKLNKYRIPVLINGDLPFRLLNLHYIDFQGEFDGGLRDLLEILNKTIDPQQKIRDEVNSMIAEGIRARLLKEYSKADNLIGQALALSPELGASLEGFWQQLQATQQTNYAEKLKVMIGYGHKPIVEQAERLPNIYGDGKDGFRWSVSLDVSDEILSQIDHVVYQLHESFSPPTRIVRDRKSNFRLTMIGWGYFRIPVEIHFQDGSIVQTSYQLKLGSES